LKTIIKKIPCVFVWLVLFTFLTFFMVISFFVSSSQGQTFEATLKLDVTSIVQKLKEKGFSKQELKNIFDDKRLAVYPEILTASREKVDYFGEKFGLLTKKSIDKGRSILIERGYILKKAESFFGVNEEVLVSILRIELDFGDYKPEYLVFNSLFTLWWLKNRRSEWAEHELICYLTICRNNNRDPFEIKGSWAGAFGLPQFIPSSYLQYAIDGNGDGKIDLFDFEDAVWSAAHYLWQHGWQPRVPIENNRQAIFAYNRNLDYVRAVITYAKVVKLK
jgi:membrane-bound lytic murein transglycosylase B